MAEVMAEREEEEQGVNFKRDPYAFGLGKKVRLGKEPTSLLPDRILG